MKKIELVFIAKTNSYNEHNLKIKHDQQKTTVVDDAHTKIDTDNRFWRPWTKSGFQLMSSLPNSFSNGHANKLGCNQYYDKIKILRGGGYSLTNEYS